MQPKGDSMSRPKSKGPTERELAILQILWEKGPATVRDVHEVLNQTITVGYTSVQKIMQIMFDKALVTRDEASQSHIYQAAQSQENTQEEIMGNILEHLFAGSATRLVATALSAKPISKKELARLKDLLKTFEDDHA
jgi:BlaI family transcriptional regulator, penicillinase repressor